MIPTYRTFYFFLLIIMAVASVSTTRRLLAAEVMLAWNASGQAAGYRLHYGLESQHYDAVIDLGNSTACSLSGLLPGRQYYMSVTAYDEYSESDFSKELVIRVPASDMDLDEDGDADGADLHTFLGDNTAVTLDGFASAFGKTYYHMDLNGDGDTDGADLHTFISDTTVATLDEFASGFGRADWVRCDVDAMEAAADEDADAAD